MSDTETTAPQADDPVATDTSTEVDTSDASTQTNETPEAPQPPEGTAELTATDTVEDKLYAGKYKSPEDMEKAYKELESKFGQTASEKAELAKILNDAFVAPAPQAQPAQPDTDNYYQEESQPVNQDIEKLKVQTAVQSFIMTHDDADSEAINKVLQADPLVQQISGHEAKLEYAYLRSQNMAKPKAIAEAEKATAQATQAKIAEKQTAQVESSSKTVQSDENTELRSRATGNYPQADRDAARKAWIRKNLVNL